MRKKNEFDTKELVRRTTSTVTITAVGLGTVLMVAIGLGLAGYAKQGRQMTRIESNQLELLRRVQTTAQQMAHDVARIEENQSKFNAVVGDVQARAGQSSANITALKQGQIELQETVQESHQKLATNIATLEQKQMRLWEIVQNNGNQLFSDIAAVDQNQRRFQSEIERLQGNIRTLATAGALEENLSTLQENLLNNTRELASIIELIGQKQLKFEERIQGDIQTMANSIGAVERSQPKLQDQIADVQARTEQTSTDIIALKKEQIELQEMVQEHGRQLDGSIAALEQKQMRLRETMENNGKQLVTNIATVDQNQRRFQSEIGRLQGDIRTLATVGGLEENLLKLQESLRNDTRDLASIIGLVGQEQLKSEEKIRSNIQTMANSIDAVERSQAKLQDQIADVQACAVESSTNIIAFKQEQIKLQETVQEDNQQSAGNIAKLEQEQTKLRQIVQNNGSQLASNIAAVDQNQRRFQSDIEGLQADIRTLATAGALEENLLTLRQNLLDNTRDLSNIIELVGQKQLKFEERIRSDIQTMVNSIGAIERSQAKLQEQIADVQARAGESFTAVDVNAIEQKQPVRREQIGDVQNEIQVMRKTMTAVLEQLRVQLSQISSQISSVMAKKEEPFVAEVEE